MNNNNISDEFKLCIHQADILTAKNLLYLLSTKNSSVWFNNEALPDIDKEADFMQPEENLLTYEQVKQLYPQWFK